MRLRFKAVLESGGFVIDDRGTVKDGEITFSSRCGSESLKMPDNFKEYSDKFLLLSSAASLENLEHNSPENYQSMLRYKPFKSKK